ncbi:MAG: ferredoxin [Acidobacteria bacterium]|nr:ferredoxin [Acidobacteriota bacterium]
MVRTALGSISFRTAAIEYPFRETEMPEHFRGLPRFESSKCVGCRLRVRDCPSQAITITKVAERQFVTAVGLGRCVYCVETCPRGAVRMSANFEVTQLDRELLRVDFPLVACKVS